MPPDAKTEPMQSLPDGSLEHLPVGLFSAVMGLFGTALAFEAAGLSPISQVFAGLAISLFVYLAGLYAVKAVKHPSAVRADWNHPVKLAFFPAISISLLLCAIVLQSTAPALAAIIWGIGAAGQAALTLAVISSWISHRGFGPGQLSPAWFIPAVGNVVAPVAGVPLGFVEASWYFLSVGLLFWIVLLTLVFNRLIFHDPLPGKLRPTIVILIAPPAVAFLAWLQLNGGVVDAFARILFNAGLFFTALVAIQLPALLRLPFAISFWAFSFPVAAMTVACFRMSALTDQTGFAALAWVLLVALTGIIAGLSWRTIRAARRGELLVPD